MNILHIIPTLKKGGAERLTIDICRALQHKQDVRVMIMTLHPENEFEFLTNELNIVCCTSNFKFSVSGKGNSDLNQYHEIVTSFKPDIIHSHLFEADFFSHESLYPDAAYCTHLHGNMNQFRNFSISTLLNKKLLANYFEKRHLIKKYKTSKQTFIANSHRTFDFFRTRLPSFLQSRIHLLTNAIDLTSFTNTGRSLGSHPLRMITVGSLNDNKNHLFLLKVLKNLLDRKLAWELDILGDGPLRQKIAERIQIYGLEEHVKLHGSVDHVDEYLASATVYVHAAKYESFGLALVEAMAMGLPVICLGKDNHNEIVDNNINGFMIEKQDPRLFSEKIIEITSDQNRYNQFSLAARNKAEQYDIRKYVADLLNIYNKLIFS